MRYVVILVGLVLGTGICAGEETDFRRWHMITGGHFEAKMTGVGTTTVRLENREGASIDFPLADLRPSDRAYVRENRMERQSTGTGASMAETAGRTEFAGRVFRDLVRLENGGLRRHKPEAGAPEYFAFYRSAHWCPPCRKFTPKLVEFYNAQKADGAPFELIFISSDRNEDAMEGYMEEYGMRWPAFEHGENRDIVASNGSGIPNLIVTDAEGNKLLDSYEPGGKYRGPTAVMRELADLLK